MRSSCRVIYSLKSECCAALARNCSCERVINVRRIEVPHRYPAQRSHAHCAQRVRSLNVLSTGEWFENDRDNETRISMNGFCAGALAISAVLLTPAPAAAADSYPTKPIRVV